MASSLPRPFARAHAPARAYARACAPALAFALLALALAFSPGCRRFSRRIESRSLACSRTAPGEPCAGSPLPPLPWKGAAIAHGGAGSPASMSDGCRAAVDAALAALESEKDPVDAAVAGVVVMEDDPRFNAGTGAHVRLDGRTVQMDASVMTSEGRFGAVAAIENVRNPVKVARAVLDTPHLLLAGDGATRFARTLGFLPYDDATDEGRAKARDIQHKLLAHDPSLPKAWLDFDWRARWNFERSPEESGLGADAGAVAAPRSDVRDAGSDTVGVAVRAPDGRFGVALSTGGTSITLRGRVGDVPILGAGLFAGKYGAAAATGTGERIVEAQMARRVEEWLAGGASAQEAARRATDLVGIEEASIIVIGPRSMAASTPGMAWAARESGSSTWIGP